MLVVFFTQPSAKISDDIKSTELPICSTNPLLEEPKAQDDAGSAYFDPADEVRSVKFRSLPTPQESPGYN